MASIPTCPRDIQGQLTCRQHASTTCMSLHYGLHQDCGMADGWLTCLDVRMTEQNKPVCADNYGVHNNSVWVQDGCEASFVACYVTDVAGSQIKHRTLECRNTDYTYKQCRVEGAKLVKDVKLKHELDGSGPCSKGISYGIFNDSMWIHSGCNGIFDIQYYDAKTSTPGATLAPSATPTPASTLAPKTPAPVKTTTPYVRYPFDPDTPRPPHGVTDAPVFSSTTPGTGAAPFQGRDNLVPITVAVFMGIFVALLLVMFAVLWICRRNTVVKRHLGDTSTGEKATRESDELSNAYEEIAPVLELSRYEKSREDDPFLASKPNNLNMEHNNNPPLPHPPNNYFILEPHSPDTPTPRGSTISSSSHGYYKVDPGAPPLMLPPPLGAPPYYGAPPLPDHNVQPYAQTVLQLDHMSNPFVRNIPSAPPKMPGYNTLQFSPEETQFVNYNTNPATFAPIPQYPSLHRHSSRSSTGVEDGYEKIEDHWAEQRAAVRSGTPDRNVRSDAPDRNVRSATPDRNGHSCTPDRLSHSSTLDRQCHSITPDRLSHSSTLERHCHSSTPDRLLLGGNDSRHKSSSGTFTSFDNHSHC